jgi:hypothetical protein
MAEIMAPGEQVGGWVVRFRDTGRYYVSDEVEDTDDLDRAATYSTQAEARGGSEPHQAGVGRTRAARRRQLDGG